MLCYSGIHIVQIGTSIPLMLTNMFTLCFADDMFFFFSHRRFVEGPYTVNTFRDIPANLADVVQLQDNYIYFFTHDLTYFQVSPWTLTPSYGYPKLTTDDWFSCEGGVNQLRIGTEPPDSEESNGSSLAPFCIFYVALLLLITSLMLL